MQKKVAHQYIDGHLISFQWKIKLFRKIDGEWEKMCVDFGLHWVEI